jgi:Mg2+ and Co2+ transporter CorA
MPGVPDVARPAVEAQPAARHERHTGSNILEYGDLSRFHLDLARNLHVGPSANRMNKIRKTSTIISIFFPLTFLAGLYGMNMPISEKWVLV